jgi:serine/threonine-protein kinase
VGNDDFVKLLDFGLVKVISGEGTGMASITASGATIGTPCYMSPEQCHGEDLDGRSDIYAVGCIVYEMLTNKRLFDGPTIVDVMMQHINNKADLSELHRLNLPKSLIAVVEKCLQKDRKARYASAQELSYQLGLVADGDAEPKKMPLFKWN